MAKEGKVLEQKKLLQPLLGTPEGIHSGCIIIFSTSAPLAVYPNVHFSFNDIFGFERASPSPHENDKSKQIVSIDWTGTHPD